MGESGKYSIPCNHLDAEKQTTAHILLHVQILACNVYMHIYKNKTHTYIAVNVGGAQKSGKESKRG